MHVQIRSPVCSGNRGRVGCCPWTTVVLHIAKQVSCHHRIARTCKWLAFGFGAVGAALVAWRLSGGVATLVERRKLRCANQTPLWCVVRAYSRRAVFLSASRVGGSVALSGTCTTGCIAIVSDWHAGGEYWRQTGGWRRLAALAAVASTLQQMLLRAAAVPATGVALQPLFCQLSKAVIAFSLHMLCATAAKACGGGECSTPPARPVKWVKPVLLLLLKCLLGPGAGTTTCAPSA